LDIAVADRIVNLRPPPATWTQKRISNYLKEAEEIHSRLGSANQAMAERLQQKIDQYAQFTESGQY